MNLSTELSFGEWLKRKRKALDLTREELADRVGYSAATVRKIEDEERRPSARTTQTKLKSFGLNALLESDVVQRRFVGKRSKIEPTIRAESLAARATYHRVWCKKYGFVVFTESLILCNAILLLEFEPLFTNSRGFC